MTFEDQMRKLNDKFRTKLIQIPPYKHHSSFINSSGMKICGHLKILMRTDITKTPI